MPSLPESGSFGQTKPAVIYRFAQDVYITCSQVLCGVNVRQSDFTAESNKVTSASRSPVAAIKVSLRKNLNTNSLQSST